MDLNAAIDRARHLKNQAKAYEYAEDVLVQAAAAEGSLGELRKQTQEAQDRLHSLSQEITQTEKSLGKLKSHQTRVAADIAAAEKRCEGLQEEARKLEAAVDTKVSQATKEVQARVTEETDRIKAQARDEIAQVREQVADLAKQKLDLEASLDQIIQKVKRG